MGDLDEGVGEGDELDDVGPDEVGVEEVEEGLEQVDLDQLDLAAAEQVEDEGDDAGGEDVLGVGGAADGEGAHEGGAQEADLWVVKSAELRECGPAALGPEDLLIAHAQHQAGEGLQDVEHHLPIAGGGEDLQQRLNDPGGAHRRGGQGVERQVQDQQRQEAVQIGVLQPIAQQLDTPELAEGLFDGVTAHHLSDAGQRSLLERQRGVLVLGERQQRGQPARLEDGRLVAQEARRGQDEDGARGVLSERPHGRIWLGGGHDGLFEAGGQIDWQMRAVETVRRGLLGDLRMRMRFSRGSARWFF